MIILVEDEGTTMFLTLVTLVAVAIVLARAVKSYMKWRGTRVIICPESRQPAGVEVDAGHVNKILGTDRLIGTKLRFDCQERLDWWRINSTGSAAVVLPLLDHLICALKHTRWNF